MNDFLFWYGVGYAVAYCTAILYAADIHDEVRVSTVALALLPSIGSFLAVVAILISWGIFRIDDKVLWRKD